MEVMNMTGTGNDEDSRILHRKDVEHSWKRKIIERYVFTREGDLIIYLLAQEKFEPVIEQLDSIPQSTT